MLAIADINVSQDMNKAALTAISGCGYWLNGRAASKYVTTGRWSGYRMVSRGRSRHANVNGRCKTITRYKYQRSRTQTETSYWDWVK